MRLPAVVVKALGLKEGDEIEISIAGRRDFKITPDRSKDRALDQLRAKITRANFGGDYENALYLVGGEPKAAAVSRGKDATPKQGEGQAIMLT